MLVHLHGKKGNAISNQMRQTKAMAPDYAVRWWSEREMMPLDIDPVAYFSAKVRWRYRHGIPKGSTPDVVLGDSHEALLSRTDSFSLILTSPPYCDVTNYRVDNWIRLWLLGENALPSWETSQRYSHRERYIQMLDDVFSASSKLLEKDAVIYVRTDARAFTRDATAEVLARLWPQRAILARHGQGKRSQTFHYGDKSEKPGEVDLLLLPEKKDCPNGFLPLDTVRKALLLSASANIFDIDQAA